MSPAAWLGPYRRKIVTADEAVRLVRSGTRICVGSGAAVPQLLVEALCRRGPDLARVEIVSLLTMGAADYCAPAWAGAFRYNAFFVGANTREAVNAGRADFTPVFLSEVAPLFRGKLPIDAALVQVAPPDEHGFCSFGVSVDVIKPAAECARVVIAEVNDRMPRTLGDAFIHVSKLSAIVECSRPIPELQREPFGEVHRAIGRHVAALVEDGSTLQMGIGAIPDAVLSFLGEKRALGVHTEMFSDGVMELFERGVITNEQKTLHPGKIVASFLLGSNRLYEFADNNPVIELHPSTYTNDPFIIAQNKKQIAINSALAVDLTGQVAASTIGTYQYSGIGGQVDFVRGAARSEGGKPIIALPATAKEGKISRIVPILEPGTSVTTSAGDVHWVVTEYGAVDLHGRTLRDRARMLISIAAPQFRDELERAARARKLL